MAGKLAVREVDLRSLRGEPSFSRFVEALQARLQELRENYETAEASEFNRGQVVAIRELLEDLKQQHLVV